MSRLRLFFSRVSTVLTALTRGLVVSVRATDYIVEHCTTVVSAADVFIVLPFGGYHDDAQVFCIPNALEPKAEEDKKQPDIHRPTAQRSVKLITVVYKGTASSSAGHKAHDIVMIKLRARVKATDLCLDFESNTRVLLNFVSSGIRARMDLFVAIYDQEQHSPRIDPCYEKKSIDHPPPRCHGQQVKDLIWLPAYAVYHKDQYTTILAGSQVEVVLTIIMRTAQSELARLTKNMIFISDGGMNPAGHGRHGRGIEMAISFMKLAPVQEIYRLVDSIDNLDSMAGTYKSLQVGVKDNHVSHYIPKRQDKITHSVRKNIAVMSIDEHRNQMQARATSTTKGKGKDKKVDSSVASDAGKDIWGEYPLERFPSPPSDGFLHVRQAKGESDARPATMPNSNAGATLDPPLMSFTYPPQTDDPTWFAQMVADNNLSLRTARLSMRWWKLLSHGMELTAEMDKMQKFLNHVASVAGKNFVRKLIRSVERAMKNGDDNSDEESEEDRQDGGDENSSGGGDDDNEGEKDQQDDGDSSGGDDEGEEDLQDAEDENSSGGDGESEEDHVYQYWGDVEEEGYLNFHDVLGYERKPWI
ncbi:hypothetical protein DFH29DRAFT_870847 [Suillus ampliporus]|nr:hypothetical protein DFH29DRAFT_870847 [Suillus ampliporus]